MMRNDDVFNNKIPESNRSASEIWLAMHRDKGNDERATSATSSYFGSLRSRSGKAVNNNLRFGHVRLRSIVDIIARSMFAALNFRHNSFFSLLSAPLHLKQFAFFRLHHAYAVRLWHRNCIERIISHLNFGRCQMRECSAGASRASRKWQTSVLNKQPHIHSSNAFRM